jgi:hypothetical protein
MDERERQIRKRLQPGGFPAEAEALTAMRYLVSLLDQEREYSIWKHVSERLVDALTELLAFAEGTEDYLMMEDTPEEIRKARAILNKAAGAFEGRATPPE